MTEGPLGDVLAIFGNIINLIVTLLITFVMGLYALCIHTKVVQLKSV